MLDEIVREEEKKEVAKAVALDLGDFETATKANEGIWVIIKHPVTDEDTSTEILILGSDSDEALRFNDELSKAAQQRLVSALAESKSRRNKGKYQDDADVSQRELDTQLLCLIVKDWKNVTWKGKELKCTPENVKMVVTKNMHVRSTLLRYHYDRDAFFQKPSES